MGISFDILAKKQNHKNTLFQAFYKPQQQPSQYCEEQTG